MILLMRNQVGEFVPGHDYTAVNLDAALVKAIAARIASSKKMRLTDGFVAEIRYWDASPRCIASPDPETVEAIEEAPDQDDGWVLLDDGALGSFEEAKTDCTLMAIVAAESPSVAWVYRVGSEPVRTVDVPLAELAARLGAPLGDPIRNRP